MGVSVDNLVKDNINKDKRIPFFAYTNSPTRNPEIKFRLPDLITIYQTIPRRGKDNRPQKNFPYKSHSPY